MLVTFVAGAVRPGKKCWISPQHATVLADDTYECIIKKTNHDFNLREKIATSYQKQNTFRVG